MSNIRDDNIQGIDAIIEYLQKLKKDKNLDKYRIEVDITPYYEEDYTKGSYVEHTKIGSKTTITIKEGITRNMKNTYLGLMEEEI